MKLSALTLLVILLVSTPSSAQILIPGLVVMHTKKKDGYFQICMNRDCISLASGKRKKIINRRNKKRLKSATAKRSTKKVYSKNLKKTASAKNNTKIKKAAPEKERKVEAVGRKDSGPATYTDK